MNKILFVCSFFLFAFPGGAVCGEGGETAAAGDSIREARYLHHCGSNELAVEKLRDILKGDAGNSGAQSLLGIVLSHMGSAQADEALIWLDLAARQKPDRPEYLVGLCRAHRKLGRNNFDKAFLYCAKAVKLDAAYDPVYREFGLLYKDTGNIKKALDSWKTGVEIAPDKYLSHYYAGLGYFFAGDYAESVKSLKQAFSLAVEDASATPAQDYQRIKLALGDSLLKSGNTADALEMFRQVAREDSGGVFVKEAEDKIKQISAKAKTARKKNVPAVSKAADIRKPAEDAGVKNTGKNPQSSEKAKGLFSIAPADMLAEMKHRRAVEPERTILSSDEISMLYHMRSAEENGAVDFIKTKLRSLSGYVVERNFPDGRLKLWLTPAGLQAYIKYSAQDAIRVFEERGTAVKDIFGLRDREGRPLFDPSGHLTLEGEIVYYEGLKGVKKWFLAGEPLPQSADAGPGKTSEGKTPKQLIKLGYMEISEPEYLWLFNATDCSEKVFTEELNMVIIKGNKPSDNRYFVYTLEPGSILAYYVKKYRSGDTSVTPKQSTAFFGLGSVEGRKLCHEGQLWH